MKKLVWMLGVLVVAGCAANPQSSSSPINWDQMKANIPAGQALILVVRPANAMGSANLYTIAINGKAVADLPTDAYVSQSVPAGDIEVSAKAVPNVLNVPLGWALMAKPVLKIKASPGEIVFVDVEVEFAGGPKLGVVTSGVGAHLVQNVRKKM